MFLGCTTCGIVPTRCKTWCISIWKHESGGVPYSEYVIHWTRYRPNSRVSCKAPRIAYICMSDQMRLGSRRHVYLSTSTLKTKIIRPSTRIPNRTSWQADLLAPLSCHYFFECSHSSTLPIGTKAYNTTSTITSDTACSNVDTLHACAQPKLFNDPDTIHRCVSSELRLGSRAHRNLYQHRHVSPR